MRQAIDGLHFGHVLEGHWAIFHIQNTWSPWTVLISIWRCLKWHTAFRLALTMAHWSSLSFGLLLGCFVVQLRTQEERPKPKLEKIPTDIFAFLIPLEILALSVQTSLW
jgi:hypothetical protein